MTESIQQFKLVIKDRLFYNRYEYAVGFHLDEVSCLRELNHARIDRMIERRIAWRDIAQQRTSGSIKSTLVGHTILTRRYKEITDTTVSNLHQLTEQLLTTSADFKLVVSVNTAHVYTNDLTLINQVSDLPGLTQKEYNRAVVGRPPNTIQLKNSTHKFRSYFKMIKLTDDQKNHLINFLANQPAARISPALVSWLNSPLRRTQDYFFIDHDTMSWLTMLSLVSPGLVRKTMQIIPAK